MRDLPEALLAAGGPESEMSDAELRGFFLDGLRAAGPRRRVLVLPPDATRARSKAAVLLRAAFDYYGDALKVVLPAAGTHRPMTAEEIATTYPGMPFDLFGSHAWRTDAVELGRVPAAFVRQASEGLCDFDWPAQANRLVAEGDFDLILSLGRVVPHEVVGMANYTKNVLVGVGGPEGIGKSHWLGAAFGIERILGRVDTPVRAVLDYAQREFLSRLPILYAMTVVQAGRDGRSAARGLFMGGGRPSFREAADLSAKINIERLDRKAETVVVRLDPREYRSTWLGNKAIYRTRLAIADGGELIVVGPGVDRFGEDAEIDAAIRRYGYRGTDEIRALMDSGHLAGNLAAAAHLAHGSTDGRFRVTYAAGGLGRAETEAAGFAWTDCGALERLYDPARLRDGWNEGGGKEFYFVRDPGEGLWIAE